MTDNESSYERSWGNATDIIWQLAEEGSELHQHLLAVHDLIDVWSKPTRESDVLSWVFGDSASKTLLARLVNEWGQMLGWLDRLAEDEAKP